MSTSTKRFVMIFLLLICYEFVTLQTRSYATTTIATTAIATELIGRKVSEIIDDVKHAGNSLLDHAEQSGNALLSKGANEANVLARNMNFILRDRLDQLFDNLSEQQKLLVIEAELFRRSLLEFKDDTYDMKDTLVLDLNAITSTLPFTENKFFVQSIRGIAFLPQKNDYDIEVKASTLGIQEDVKTTLSLSIGNKDDSTSIQNIRVDQSRQRFVAKITIPNNELSGFYKRGELSIVPLNIKFKVIRKKGWWLFKKDITSEFNVPVYLSLYPPLAAKLTATIKLPEYSWVKVGDKEMTKTTPNRHCKDNCRGEPTRGGNLIEFKVAGGPEPYKKGYRKFSNLQFKCIRKVCGWSHINKVTLTDYDTRAYASWDTWSKPGTWLLKADILEWQETGEKTTVIDNISLEFDALAEVLFPKGWTYAKIELTTFTKKRYEVKVVECHNKGI